MSRLDYISGQELSVLTIAEEVDGLERLVRSGQTMDPQDVQMLSECVNRLSQLVAASSHAQDDVPLPEWLQPLSTSTSSGAAVPDPKLPKSHSG